MDQTIRFTLEVTGPVAADEAEWHVINAIEQAGFRVEVLDVQ